MRGAKLLARRYFVAHTAESACHAVHARGIQAAGAVRWKNARV